MNAKVCVSLWFMSLLPVPCLPGQTPGIVVRDAWARVPLAASSETAVFMVVENHTNQKRTIVSIACGGAAAAEIHEMIMQRAIMKMVPVPQVSIKPNGKFSFDPNDYHVMLFGLKKRPSVGDTIQLTLKLDDGAMVPVTATFRKANAN